ATGDSEGWSVSSLSTSLLIGEEQERIKALSELNRENLKRLIQEVILCAYHWKATVRIAAYKALTHADPSDISQVIRDALSDHDGEARRVAVQIFGNREK
ncbi:MAG: hypothetical protein KDD60_07740, partial [Bdellovibrionales bacterium]|nr:hypothetical protein [Bdellovibrionales bacterium]